MAALGLREQAVGAPALLVEVDERGQVREGIRGVVAAGPRRRPPPGGPCAGSRGAPSCRGWPSSRPSSRPPGSVATGQTSSRSTLSVQPWAISRAPNAAASASAAGSPHRSRRRSTASHGIGCRDRPPCSSTRRAPPPPPAGPRARRAAWRSRRGTRRRRRPPSRRAARASARAHRRGGSSCGARRRRTPPRGGASAGRSRRASVVRGAGRDEDQGLLVGVAAVPVPPGAVERPALKGVAQGFALGEGVPAAGSIASNGRRTARSGRVQATGDVVTGGRRTGRFAGQVRGDTTARIHRDRKRLRAQSAAGGLDAGPSVRFGRAQQPLQANAIRPGIEPIINRPLPV